MRLDNVLFTGSTTTSHPLLDRLFGGLLQPPKEGKTGALDSYRLVVVDARMEGDDLAEGGLAQHALEAGIAVLVIAPNAGQMRALISAVGGGPVHPAQAVFIAATREGTGRRFDVKVLGYPVLSRPKEWKDQPARLVPQDHRDVIGDFAVQVERGAESGGKAVGASSFPDGLKWFSTTWNKVTPITYATSGDENFTNTSASLTHNFTVWAFQNVTSSAVSTYVILQGTSSLYPGTLAQNNDEGRGVMNLWFQSGIAPNNVSVTAVNHIPTNGVNAWAEGFEIPISYKDPFGSYRIYTFTAQVDQAIDSWSVQDTSAAQWLGSKWFVNSPVNGLIFPEDRSGGFTGSGHVEPFPSACTGTLTVKEASAWQINSAFEGTLRIMVDNSIVGFSIYGQSCGLLFCYDPESAETIFSIDSPFEVIVRYQ